MFIEFLAEQWVLVCLLMMAVAFLFLSESKRAGEAVTPQKLSQMVNQENALLLDIRDSSEFRAGHIVDSLNIPNTKMDDRKVELEKHKERPIIVICKMGQTASGVAKQLTEDGYKVYRLSGGISEWQASQMPLVKGRA